MPAENITQEAFRLGYETAEYALKLRIKELEGKVVDIQDVVNRMEYFLRHFTEYDSGV